MRDLEQRIANLPPEKRRELEARLLEQRLQKQEGASPVRRHESGPLPLSFGQLRLWFLDQLEPGSSAYNIPLVLKLKGALDIRALEGALGGVVARHEALRTKFASEDGEPVQVVVPGAPITLLPAGARELHAVDEDRALDDAREEARRPFDLTLAPPVRFQLLKLSEDEHWLVVTLHHIVADGWSLSVLQEELAAAYLAQTEGGEPSAAKLAVQYPDYAVWQRERAESDALRRQLDYWRVQLEGAPTLSLPTDHPRPELQSYRGAMFHQVLPHELVEDLRVLGRAHQATLYMVLLAALNVLFFRYTGQKDVCIGSPIAGRSREEFESLIGMFVNNLVLRTDLSGDPSFVELLRRVRATALEAFDHQDVPFEMLVEEIQPDRDLGSSPLFQAMLVLQNQPTPPSRIGDVEMERTFVDIGTTHFDLTFYVTEQTVGLEVAVEYSSDLFEPSTIRRLVDQFATLLRGVAEAPETKTSRLPLLPVEERRRVLDEWNRTDADYPSDRTVHDLIAEQAQRTPGAVAIEVGQTQLTYGELERKANQLARALQSLGVERGTGVGLCTERSAEMLIGLLGILKAGGAYVPLDPSFPPDRLAYMAKDAELSVLVTESGLRGVVPSGDARVLELDGDWAEIAAESGDPLEGAQGPEDLAYVIYTSGSTGQPKGVQIEHRALVNFLWSMKHEPGFSDRDRLLAVTTLSFDIAGLELYLPLISGGTVVLASGAQASDGDRLAALISETRATVMQATPSTWRMLLEAGWKGADGLRILCGGEALPMDLAERLLDCGAEVWNLYGPTETTIWSAAHRVTASDDRVFVGRPIANTTLYLLDPAGEPVPTGVPGELYIGGDGVARGYLGKEELTRGRFVSAPRVDGGRRRLYRTGDLARYHADGTLQVLGRLDHQVKVRGFRIELGEIESVLTGHARVGQAVVVARRYGAGDDRLVAYLVPEGEAPGAEELRAHAKVTLPDYMVPAAYVRLDAFPLTPNGKIDRRALPEPEGVGLDLADEPVAPRTPTEELVAAVWADLLKVEHVGVRDSFFDLGGHSLLAIRLVSRLEKATGRRVPPVEVFRGGTVEHLAQWLDGVEKSDWGSAVSLMREGGSQPPFFAIGSNQYLADVPRRVDPETPFYRLDVYALQSGRADRGEEVFQSIEEIAAHMVESIRSVEPTGPYYLGGACEGAFTAFEVAKQLQDAGEQIASLVLWFTVSPDFRRAGKRVTALPAKGIRRLRKLLRRSFVGGRTTKSLVRHEQLRQRTFRAMDAYRPQTPFRGRLSLIQTIEDELALKDLTFGWNELATEGAEVRTMDGNHLLMLKERPDEFGDHLDGFLRAAREEPAGAGLPAREIA